MSKAESQVTGFLQILNKPANRKLAGFLRIRAGLPSRGLRTEQIDLTKHDIHRICQNMALYRAKLLIKYPELFDTLISQDESSVDFWTEYFIYGYPLEKSREIFNIYGCEVFSLPNGFTKNNIALPKGIYIRFGTNNSIKNLKDFIAQNSRNILKKQEQTFGKMKLPNLKPKKYELRDKVVTTLYFTEMTQLKKQAIELGFERNLQDIYRYSAVEAKEKIICLFVQKLFKNKLSNGSIRSIAEANKHLLD
ncbi:hypothetical protein IPH92_02395 [Candidatus Kaiserbacteria bacterium]|nr:MAG: hypothetical protein IPH92_02395 [Candidatus Kaiserbacteria bacterium]